MRIQSRATTPRGPSSAVDSTLTSPLADRMMDSVMAFASGGPVTHAVISGGFGSGKSYAIDRATEAALRMNLRVAALERGPLGISSYADFLVAVAKATRPGALSVSDVDAWRRDLKDEAKELSLSALEQRVLRGPGEPGLVIVIESLDQLLHQVRSTDRPRLVELLRRGTSEVLILGSVHGTGLADELGDVIQFVHATYLPTIEAGIPVALQEAQRLGAEHPKLPQRLIREASELDESIRSNWLFWSLVGRYLAIARRDPLRWAELDLRSRAASHFDALLLTLAPSEQRILLALAELAGPRTVGELADVVGVRNQAAATAIGRLHADDWVQIVEMQSASDRRRTWYEIADPLLRLHLLPPQESGGE